MLTNADQLIEALKTCGLVNITWGGEQNMLCGNPLYNLPDAGRVVRQRESGVGDQSGEGSDQPKR